MQLTKRKLGSGALSLTLVAIIIAILVVANFLANRAPARIDLTSDNRYTLAPVSVETAQNLPGDVQVDIYFSSDLPGFFEQMKRDITDLMTEYQTYSDGRLSFRFIDPQADEADAARAEHYGVEEYPLPSQNENEVSVRIVSTGIVMTYDDPSGAERSQTIATITPADNHEFLITRALRELVSERESKPVIGILVGDGGFLDPFVNVPPGPQTPSPEDVEQDIATQLEAFFEDQYEIDLVHITDPPPEEVEGLFILGPTEELSDEMKYWLDQLIMSGRPVALMVSPYRMDYPQFDQPGMPAISFPTENETGWSELLEAYGIGLNQDTVVEANDLIAQVSMMRHQVRVGDRTGISLTPVSDPRLPVMTNLSDTSLLVPNLPLVAFLPSDREQVLSQSSLRLLPDLLEARSEGRVAVDEVLLTSESSYRLGPDDAGPSVGLESVQPYVEAFRAQEEGGEASINLEQGPFLTAVSVVGELESAFPDRSDEGHVAETSEARLFVVANGDWVKNLLQPQDDPMLSARVMRMLPRSVLVDVNRYRETGQYFLRNIADWLVQDLDLVSIRVRQEPVFIDSTEVTEADRTFYKTLNIAGIPIVFCMLGLAGFLFRQARRAGIERRFATKASGGRRES
ncbi:MAG: GldG family protein [Myxococcales bacterium]|nr:GldG family protein [Myxococcales bacterium]